MKKTIVSVAASAVISALSLIGVAAHATGPVGDSGVQSGSQIVLSAGVSGGAASGGVFNRQTATINPGTSLGAGGTLLGQSAGAAGVSGSAETSTLTMGSIISHGAAGGELMGGGNSSVTQSQSNSYATNNAVSGSVNGSLANTSASQVQAADNGGGVLKAGTSANYAATADSSKTGIFSSNRTANTSAIGAVNTTTPTTLTWGNSAFSLSNNAAITAGAQSQSGTLTSVSNP